MIYQVKQNTEDIIDIKKELQSTKEELSSVRQELKDAKDIIERYLSKPTSFDGVAF